MSEYKWPGFISELTEDEAVIRYDFNGHEYLVFLPLEKVPEDCRQLGQYCRIEDDTFVWCDEVWTQEDIDAAKAETKRLCKLFGVPTRESRDTPGEDEKGSAGRAGSCDARGDSEVSASDSRVGSRVRRVV